jgi:hypothetical protein
MSRIILESRPASPSVRPLLILGGAGLLLLASCAVPGKAEDFQWSLDVPPAVDRGADLVFRVQARRASGETVEGVSFRYLILWTGGSSSPLRHGGHTGTPVTLRARIQAGPATLIITSEDQAGKQVKVAEGTFEVK